MNRKPMFSAAAALLTGVVLVAGAVSPAAASNDPAKKKQEEVAAPAKANPAGRKYCANTEKTGSRILVQECLTRDVWIDRYDFDPLKALNKR